MAKSNPKREFPDRKISDTFLQFVGPLLDGFGLDATEAQMEQLLMIPWTVWNAVVYADAAANGHMLESIRASMEHDRHFKEFVEALIERKRTDFGDDQRLIGEFKVLRKDGEFRLRAEARDPNSWQQSS